MSHEEYEKKYQEALAQLRNEEQEKMQLKKQRMEIALRKAIDVINGGPLNKLDNDYNLVVETIRTLDKVIKTEEFIEKCNGTMIEKFNNFHL